MTHDEIDAIVPLPRAIKERIDQRLAPLAEQIADLDRRIKQQQDVIDALKALAAARGMTCVP